MAMKSSLLLKSILVVAIAMPATATAGPAVTDPGGTLVEPGALIQFTGAVSQVTSLGKISCNTFDITGELVSNIGSTVGAEGVGEGTAALCFLGGSKVVQTTDLTLEELHAGVEGKGIMSVSFSTDVGNVTCHYQSPTLPFTYTSGGDVLKVTEGNLQGTPAACEPGLLNGQFTIETDGGGAVVLD